MKRLLIFIGLLMSFQSFAQSTKEFALKTGYNLTNFGDVKGLTGYEFGVSYKKMFSEKIAAEIGMNYRKQSMLENVKAVETDLDARFISIPLAGRYYINQELYLRLGMQFSLITEARIDDASDVHPGLNPNIKDDFNFLHFNGVGGFGYTIDKTIDIQLEYNLGLTDKFIEPSIARNTDGNNYFTVSIGWILFKE